MRISGPQPLSSGDSLQLGTLTLRFQAHVQAASTEAITNVGMPAPQVIQQPLPPAPSYTPAYAAPARAGNAPLWPFALGIGAVLVLALIGLGLAFVLFRGLGSEATTVEITSPATGAQVTVGEAMPVLAVASDPRGIARVELWVNGRLADSMVNPSASGRADFPVQFQWTADEQGSHLLEIRAYNRDGRSSEPASVLVRAVPGAAPTPTIVIALVEPTLTGMTALTQTSPIPTVGPAPGSCASGLAFVADVTIPDYTQVQPGQRVDKIWRVRNSGTCPWGPGYVLAYAGGDQMSAPPAQAVGSTPPGGTADVQVTMYAPGAPGTYTGYWQMRDAAGQSFGSRLTVVIVVPLTGGPPADTPTTAPEPGPWGCLPTIDFRVDRTTINAGERTTVRWDVECVREVYFQGGPVTGHESREVSPAGTTTYTLRVVRNDGGSEERQVTVSVTNDDIGVVEEEPAEPNVNISFHSYDAASRWVTLRVFNTGGVALESARATFNAPGGGGVLYGPGTSDSPFRDGPASDALVDSVAPGATKYMRYKLRAAPSGTAVAATIELYAGEGCTGQSLTRTLGFTLP